MIETMKSIHSYDLTARAGTPYDRAVMAARGYNGSERGLKSVVEIISLFERVARDLAETQGLAMPRDRLERKIAHGQNADEKPRSVQELLALAIESFGRQLRAKEIHIPTIETGLCFAPTDGPGLQPPGPNRTKPYEVLIRPRTDQLMVALAERGIHIEDTVRYNGTVDRRMTRKAPYTLLHIKRIDREVLICDQVGETAFIGEGLRGPLFWASYRKDQLEKQEGVTSFDLTGRDWPQRLVARLLDGNPIRAKEDVALIRDSYPLSADIILIAALRHAAANEGKLPTTNSSDVIGMPDKHGRVGNRRYDLNSEDLILKG